jgi:polar amino acid transport system substrate-binding protein
MEEIKMKKILAFLLALACLSLCFVGCATENDEKDTKTTEAAKTTDATTNAATEDKEPEPKPILKMATNAYFQPYEFYQDGKIVGIDAEIAAAIAEYLGYELVIEDMEFDTILTAVKEGSVDFGMAGMTITEDRLLEVDFSNSYATGVQSVIVKADSAIPKVDDLFADGATYKVGVQQGTTGDIYATDDLGADRVTPYNNANNAVLALVGNDVDCVIIDNEPAKALVKANAGLKILDTSYADEDYAICVKKGNKELLDKINEAIVALTKDGTIDKIVAKYIPAES